jgi:hypothetical protein
MDLLLILLATTAVIASVWFLWRWSTSRNASPSAGPSAEDGMTPRPELPASGLLVHADVLRTVDSTSGTIWHALEATATPMAIEYYPVSPVEFANFRTVPVNATAQQALVNIANALDSKTPTLYRVVLPKGAELVKAVGQSGLRGFSRAGGKTAHAVLKPVGAVGAIAAGWPVLAVAGTVVAIDMVSQRQQLAHQRQVESILGRQEERHYIERIKDQRSADAQLSRAISLLLDGRTPPMELALKSADDEFHRSTQFLDKYKGATDGLVDEDGKVDYRRLEEALGGKTKDVDHFIRELHLARAAIAIKRKALVADAASVALADPSNPYTALQKFLGAQIDGLDQAETAADELTLKLTALELKGPWHRREMSVSRRQAVLRERIAPPTVDDTAELLYLSTGSGDIVQVLPSDIDEAELPASVDGG